MSFPRHEECGLVTHSVVVVDVMMIKVMMIIVIIIQLMK